MSLVPPLDALATLREVNQKLRAALLRLHPERKSCSSIKPGDLSDLEAQIARAVECLPLQSQPGRSNAALDREKLAYRRNLEEIRQFLPGLHVRLMAEKARLEMREIRSPPLERGRKRAGRACSKTPVRPFAELI